MATVIPLGTEASLAESRYIRPREAAKWVGISETEVRRAIHSGELPARRYRSKRWLIDRLDLEQWVLSCTTSNVA